MPISVFSTHVEVILHKISEVGAAQGILHTCGGDPNLQHIQQAVIKDMKAHGAIVYVVFNKLQAEGLIKKLTKGMPKKKSYAVQHKDFLDNLGKSYKIYSVDS